MQQDQQLVKIEEINDKKLLKKSYNIWLNYKTLKQKFITINQKYRQNQKKRILKNCLKSLKISKQL